MNGGYDDGYRSCPCFWGKDPGSLLIRLKSYHWSFTDKMVLDAGCGEGKNASFLAAEGAKVHAIDVSQLAIKNARSAMPANRSISWVIADISTLSLPLNYYDGIVAYGLLHCLNTPEQIKSTVKQLQDATRVGGWHVLCAFNIGHHDMRAHPGFRPTLLSHSTYLSFYSEWEIEFATNEQLYETHPNNNLPHSHSLTRLIARKGTAGDLSP